MIDKELELYETRLTVQRLINRIRQSVNKGEIVLPPHFQKDFDRAVYIIQKYHNPKDSFKIVQS